VNLVVDIQHDNKDFTAPENTDPPIIIKGSFPCGDTSERHSASHQVQHLLSMTTEQSTICQTDTELLEDIQASYKHLCHLGFYRWSFAQHEGLPPHIQAIRTFKSISLA
jgi:hypothetical protein